MSFQFRAIALAEQASGGWTRDHMSVKDAAYGMSLGAELRDLVKGRSPTNAATTVAGRAELSLTYQRLLTEAIEVLAMTADGEVDVFTKNHNMLWADTLTHETYRVGRKPGRLSIDELFAGIGKQFKRADLLYQGPFGKMLEAVRMVDRIADGNRAFRLHLIYEFS